MVSAVSREGSLSSRLLAAIEAQKQLSAGQYPLSIRELAALAGPEIQPEEVKKALGQQPAKGRIVVAHAKSLDAPLALAEDATQLAHSDKLLEWALEQTCSAARPTCNPKTLKAKVAKPLQADFAASIEIRLNDGTLPRTTGQRTKGKNRELFLLRFPTLEQVLAENLLRMLESQRTLGAESYPLTQAHLVELTDRKAPKTRVTEAFKHPLVHDKFLLLDLKSAGCLVALAEDQDLVLRSPALVEFLIKAKHKRTEHAFAVDKIGKGLPLMAQIVKALKTQIDTNTLPPTVAWMWIGKKQHIFLIEDVRQQRQTPSQQAPRMTLAAPLPASPASATDFVRSFDEAFTRLDRLHGSHNFVHLKEIREVLPFARDIFDAQLRALRLAGRYTLSAAEGRHGLTAEERQAGIVEEGSLLLYVSRRVS